MKMRLLSLAALAGIASVSTAFATVVVTPEVTVTAGSATNFFDVTLSGSLNEQIGGYDYLFTLTPVGNATGAPTFTGDYAILPSGVGITPLIPGVNPNQGTSNSLSAGAVTNSGTVALDDEKTVVRLVFGTTAASSGTFLINVNLLFSSFTDATGNPVPTVTFDSTGSITVNPIPEPASLSLLGLGGLALLRRKRA